MKSDSLEDRIEEFSKTLTYDLLHGKIALTYEGDNPRQKPKRIRIYPSHGVESVEGFIVEDEGGES